MESKYLLENEAIISQSKNAAIVLTNIRIRHSIKGSGSQRITSIFLEKIAAIETQNKSYPLLLFLGIVSACFGIYLMMERGTDLAQIGFGAAGISILIYAATHKRIMLITSDGGAKISYQTRGMRKEAIAHFINDIEKAKNEKYSNTN